MERHLVEKVKKKSEYDEEKGAIGKRTASIFFKNFLDEVTFVNQLTHVASLNFK